jgi:UDP-N-acetylglucosamine transferase subunit ALG13
MIFLTVGTYPLPFDRLVEAVDAAVRNGLIQEEIFAQIGWCRYRPQHMAYVEMLEKESFDSYLRESSAVVSHAGVGIITMALDNGKPLLAMPRLKKHGEVVNDHQVATARKFEELGHILVAYEVQEIPDKLQQLTTFKPRKRQAQPQAVAERICCFLKSLEPRQRQAWG